eukprot:925784-Heterocapsa_arctica.AAC.1
MYQNQRLQAHQKVPRTGIPPGKRDHPPPQEHSAVPGEGKFGSAELSIGSARPRMDSPREEDL